MYLTSLKTKCALALVIGGLLTAGPVLADKPEGNKGKGKGNSGHSDRRDDGGKHSDRRGHDGNSQGNGDRHAAPQRGHFEDRHRTVVREYYTTQYQEHRHCPPGLKKKNHGCMPPGQAKKWQVGRPLPREVIYYEVPRPLVVQIGPPPQGYRYVRVAGDILMIAIGTGMVVDAIQDLLG